MNFRACDLLVCARLPVGVEERKKNERVVKWLTSEKRREETMGEPVSIFLRAPIRPLPEETFLESKCQNVKRCVVRGFHMLDMFVRLCGREA